MAIKDRLGDRMKKLEQRYDSRLLGGVPCCARIDGKNFSQFTRGLERPDERLSTLMIETTLFLMKQTNAACSYTQSDEISLVWQNDEEVEANFSGRVQKLTSLLASWVSTASCSSCCRSGHTSSPSSTPASGRCRRGKPPSGT